MQIRYLTVNYDVTLVISDDSTVAPLTSFCDHPYTATTFDLFLCDFALRLYADMCCTFACPMRLCAGLYVYLFECVVSRFGMSLFAF